MIGVTELDKYRYLLMNEGKLQKVVEPSDTLNKNMPYMTRDPTRKFQKSTRAVGIFNSIWHLQFNLASSIQFGIFYAF